MTVIDVCNRLSDHQREQIVERFTGVNPHWKGAEAADIIDVLCSQDSDLKQVEEAFAEYPTLAKRPGFGEAARALIWSGTEITSDNLSILLGMLATAPDVPTSDVSPPDANPVERHAGITKAASTVPFDEVMLKQQLEMMGTRLKLSHVALGWMLLAAAKSIEHTGAALIGIYDDTDRNAVDSQLRGLYRNAIGTINQIRTLYSCDLIDAPLPPQDRKEVSYEDR